MLSSKLSDATNSAGKGEKAAGKGNSDVGSVSRSPAKARSLSDASPPVLSPSPKFREPEKRSKDDASIDTPTTPRRPAFQRGLSLQMPPNDLMSASSLYNAVPLSPKLSNTNTYGSPSSVIPRRSRGMDFSRAATNLHHSTLAEQSSPDSSPTITGRAMNIPHRRSGNFGSVDMAGNSSSLWSTLGNQDRMTVSSSLGSVNMLGSESSGSSSDDDDPMDADDIDDSILTTPQVNRNQGPFDGVAHPSPGSNWMNGPSPAVSSLMNFQRARMRHGKNRKHSNSGSRPSMASLKPHSPPTMRTLDGASTGLFNKEKGRGSIHSRRESISWAANQLHISGSESDDNNLKSTLENTDGLPTTPGRDGQRGVIRRPVTRRGNMLPKTKGFARIRAALAEESAPVESEVRREADVVRQVRENDGDLEPTRHSSNAGITAQSSPGSGPAVVDPLEEILEDDMMADSSSNPSNGPELSSSFKRQALLNSRGKEFWDKFPEEHHRTPPPFFLPRSSSSVVSDDVLMDSPSLSTPSSNYGGGFSFPFLENLDGAQRPSSPGRSATPQPFLPTAADITRKVNNKRRRDDDFDPTSFKRRAVSPGMSVHNSPVMQSPMQRDPWGSRPGSNGGSSGTDKATAPPSNDGSSGGRGTKRIGFQGMVDTNDGLMKMSIE